MIMAGYEDISHAQNLFLSVARWPDGAAAAVRALTKRSRAVILLTSDVSDNSTDGSSGRRRGSR
jgi:hypothetical protein